MEKENFWCILCRVCLQPRSLSIAQCLLIFSLIWASVLMVILFIFSFHHHTLFTHRWQQRRSTLKPLPFFPWVVLSWSSFTDALYTPHPPFRISALVSLMSIMQCAFMLQWKSSRFFTSEEPCLQLCQPGELSCVQTAPSKISNTIHDNHRILEGLEGRLKII